MTGTFVYDQLVNSLLTWNQGHLAYTRSYDVASRLYTVTAGSLAVSMIFDRNSNWTVDNSGGVQRGHSFDFENR